MEFSSPKLKKYSDIPGGNFKVLSLKTFLNVFLIFFKK